MYFPIFVAKQPKLIKSLNHYAKDPTLRESLQIKSTTSGLDYFFIKANFGILDDVGALWNPSTIDHVIPDQLKIDPLIDLEAKAVQSANQGSILSTKDLLCGVKHASRYNKIYVEPYIPQFMAQQFDLIKHLPMFFWTMTLPTSRPLLSCRRGKEHHQLDSLDAQPFQVPSIISRPKEIHQFL